MAAHRSLSPPGGLWPSVYTVLLFVNIEQARAQAFIGANVDPKINRWLDSQLTKTVQSMSNDNEDGDDGLPDQPLHAGATVAATEMALNAGRGPRDDLLGGVLNQAPDSNSQLPVDESQRARSGQRRRRPRRGRQRRRTPEMAMVEYDEAVDDATPTQRRRERGPPIDEPAIERDPPPPARRRRHKSRAAADGLEGPRLPRGRARRQAPVSDGADNVDGDEMEGDGAEGRRGKEGLEDEPPRRRRRRRHHRRLAAPPAEEDGADEGEYYAGAEEDAPSGREWRPRRPPQQPPPSQQAGGDASSLFVHHRYE